MNFVEFFNYWKYSFKRGHSEWVVNMLTKQVEESVNGLEIKLDHK